MRIIGGKFRSRNLQAPKGKHTRPTSSRLRGMFFDICQGLVEGESFLDVFAGAGAMGLEAISRGAADAVFIEKNKSALSCIRNNAALLGVENQIKIFCGDAIDMLLLLAKKGKCFPMIYVDPPYKTVCQWRGQEFLYSELVLKIIDEKGILQEDGVLFLEEASLVDLAGQSLCNLVMRDKRACGSTMLWHYEHALS